MSHGVIKIILFQNYGNEYTICLFDLKTLNTCLLLCHLVCLRLYEHQWLFNWTSILTMAECVKVYSFACVNYKKCVMFFLLMVFKKGQVLHNDQYYIYLEYGIANINKTNIDTCT